MTHTHTHMHRGSSHTAATIGGCAFIIVIMFHGSCIIILVSYFNGIPSSFGKCLFLSYLPPILPGVGWDIRSISVSPLGVQ